MAVPAAVDFRGITANDIHSSTGETPIVRAILHFFSSLLF